MITPSKEGSKEECGTRVEVNQNSDILERILNTDKDASDLSWFIRRHIHTPRVLSAAPPVVSLDV